MKKNLKNIIEACILIAAAIWILLQTSFSTKIDKDIAATVYENGTVKQETLVHIHGKRTNRLLSDTQYFGGQFWIESYEQSGRENMLAGINWHKKHGYTSILYDQNGTFPEVDISRQIKINKEMDEFAIGFTDGSVAATSKELYQNYVDECPNYDQKLIYKTIRLEQED